MTDNDQLPISEHTGKPYDPEWGIQPLLNRPINPKLQMAVQSEIPIWQSLRRCIWVVPSAIFTGLVTCALSPFPVIQALVIGVIIGIIHVAYVEIVPCLREERH